MTELSAGHLVTVDPTPTIGDVFGIATPDGCAVMQYVFDFGDGKRVMRVLPGLHQCDADRLHEVVARPEQFLTVHVVDSVDASGLAHLGNFPVPMWAQGRPHFRVEGGRFGDNGRWLRFDGRRTSRLGRVLRPEDAGLSIYGVAGTEFILSRVRSGYRPADDIGDAIVRRTKGPVADIVAWRKSRTRR